MNRLLTALLLLLACPVFASGLGDSALHRAMQDELERSMQSLALEGMESPYFIAYSVVEGDERTIHATDGALVLDQGRRWRLVQVEVRVGDHDFDNTNYAGNRRFFGVRPVMLPLTDDYAEIRRQLWLATDAAYKAALEAIAGKRATLQNRVREEALPDFSRETVYAQPGDPAFPVLEARGSETRVLALAEALARRPEITRSDVMLITAATKLHFINSEGTYFTRDTPFTALAITAGTQAEDGRVVEDLELAYAERVADLPSQDVLLRSVDALATRLGAQREAPLLGRFNGPVLFEGQAAAEVVAQTLASELVAQRLPIMDSSMGGMQLPATSFQERIGARVLPRFVDVIDDPAGARFADLDFPFPLTVDDTGVPAEPTVLIERGRLKTLLSGRTPTRDIQRSSGNTRAGAVLPSNVVFQPRDPLGRETLLEELMALVDESGNEYGIVVTRLTNPTVPSGVGQGELWMMGPGMGGNLVAAEAFLVYPDGRRERVRNVELVGVTPQAFRDIVAVGEVGEVHTAPLTADGAFGMQMFSMNPSRVHLIRRPTASWAVPALLFEELTLRRPEGDNPSLPLVPRPVVARD